MRKIGLLLVWIGFGMTAVGFVLPWARVDMRQPGVVKQLSSESQKYGATREISEKIGDIFGAAKETAGKVTGVLPVKLDVPTRVAGVDIPRLANQQNAKLAVAIVELLTGSRQQVGLKSYGVYALPGLAFLLALIATLFPGRRTGGGGGMLAAAVAGIGFWKLTTVNTETLFVAVVIEAGLWLSLWGYMVIAAGGGVSALTAKR